MVCEVFAGALTGGRSSHPENPDAKKLNNNMFSIVFNPDNFSGNEYLYHDVSRLIEWVKSSSPISKDDKVLIPGELERKTRKQRTIEGVPINLNLRKKLHNISVSLGLSDEKMNCLEIHKDNN